MDNRIYGNHHRVFWGDLLALGICRTNLGFAYPHFIYWNNPDFSPRQWLLYELVWTAKRRRVWIPPFGNWTCIDSGFLRQRKSLGWCNPLEVIFLDSGKEWRNNPGNWATYLINFQTYLPPCSNSPLYMNRLHFQSYLKIEDKTANYYKLNIPFRNLEHQQEFLGKQIADIKQ